MLCGQLSLFPKHKLTLLVGKGPTFRLYAGALIERCFNAILATHKGLIMPAEAMSFLFCSGSCKQFTRTFPHTCETSTGSNKVIYRKQYRKLLLLAAAAGCLLLLRVFQPLPFVHLRRLKSSHLMCLKLVAELLQHSIGIDTQEADVNQSSPHSFRTSVPLVFALGISIP